jgi:hypothetical protein
MPGTLGKITQSRGKGGRSPRTVYASNKFGIFEEINGGLHVTTLSAGGHRGLTVKDGLIYWFFRMIHEKGLKDPDQ